MQETELLALTPAQLRLHEAKLFLDEFRRACGSPITPDNYLAWIANADAFAMTLVSVEELVSERVKKKLHSSDVFGLMKAMRNMSVHESVWPGPRQRRGATPTVARTIYLNIGVNRWVEPTLLIPNIRAALTRRLRKWPRDRRAIEGARRFLTKWKRCNGATDQIPLDELLTHAFDEVKRISGVRL